MTFIPKKVMDRSYWGVNSNRFRIKRFYENTSNKDQFFESKSILLDESKAKHLLNWEPFWDFNITVEKTILWYKNYYLKKKSAIKSCVDDINSFMN